MTATPVFNLGKYLREHGLSAYALVKEVQGKVPASTVYGLARKPAQRIDLPTVYTLLDALGQMQNTRVEFEDFVERRSDSSNEPPTLEQLLAQVPLPDLTTPQQFRYSGKGKRVDVSGGPSIANIISEGRER